MSDKSRRSGVETDLDIGMEYEEVDGEKIPVIGLGTWRMKRDTCKKAVDSALELGYRHIDTAQYYGNEEEVGDAIEEADVERDDVFVTTKLMNNRINKSNLEYDDVIESTEESLNKLGTDYVDLLLIHWPSRKIPVEETLNAMNELRDKGKVRHIGVSNFSLDKLRNAIEVSDSPIVTDQVEYHPFKSQDGILEFCRSNDILLTAYSPLTHGGVTVDGRLKEIGEKYGKTPAQISLRWLTQQDNVITIPKSKNEGHQKENIDIFDFELDEDEMRRISRPSRIRTLYNLVKSKIPL